jgi:hypothetical protein
LPLYTMMSQLLGHSGVQVSPDFGAIFDWMSRETPAYADMTFTTIGPMGAEIPKEVVR